LVGQIRPPAAIDSVTHSPRSSSMAAPKQIASMAVDEAGAIRAT